MRFVVLTFVNIYFFQPATDFGSQVFFFTVNKNFHKNRNIYLTNINILIFMNTTENKFKTMGKKDLKAYYRFMKEQTKDCQKYNYEYCANLDQYSTYDVFQIKINLYNGTQQFQYVELKGRDIPITKHPDCAVDLSKIQKLQQLTITTGIPSYVVGIYYLSDKITIWKLDENKQYPFEKMWVTETQADESRQQKVLKDMVLLDFKDAVIYDFNL